MSSLCLTPYFSDNVANEEQNVFNRSRDRRGNENMLPIDDDDFSQASSSQLQQDDAAPCQKPASSTEIEEEEQPEEETATGE